MISDLSFIGRPLIYGDLVFRLEPDKEVERPRGLDGLTQFWQTDSKDSFKRGGAPPDYPFMRIRERETICEYPGLAYTHRLQCDGLLTADDKIESDNVQSPEEGWDEGTMDILTLNPAAYESGQQHPTIPTLWSVSCDTEKVNEVVFRVKPLFRGFKPLVSTGLPKSRKRRITNNSGSQAFSVDVALGYNPAHTFTPFVNEAGVFNGWEDARPTTMDTGRVTVTDSFLTNFAPPTDKIPGNLTPDNAPVINDIFGYSWMSFSGGVTYNWPWGWTLKGIQSEQLLDKSIYLTTLTTEFVPLFSPKG